MHGFIIEVAKAHIETNDISWANHLVSGAIQGLVAGFSIVFAHQLGVRSEKKREEQRSREAKYQGQIDLSQVLIDFLTRISSSYASMYDMIPRNVPLALPIHAYQDHTRYDEFNRTAQQLRSELNAIASINRHTPLYPMCFYVSSWIGSLTFPHELTDDNQIYDHKEKQLTDYTHLLNKLTELRKQLETREPFSKIRASANMSTTTMTTAQIHTETDELSQ